MRKSTATGGTEISRTFCYKSAVKQAMLSFSVLLT